MVGASTRSAARAVAPNPRTVETASSSSESFFLFISVLQTPGAEFSRSARLAIVSGNRIPTIHPLLWYLCHDHRFLGNITGYARERAETRAVSRSTAGRHRRCAAAQAPARQP